MDETRPVEEIEQALDEGAESVRGAAGERLSAARERLTEVAQGVEKKLQQARASAGRTTQEVRDQLKEKAGQASAAARERYDVTVEQVRHGYEKARKDLGHLSEEVNEYVRDNPGKSLLVAAGLGFLVGLLFRGNRRDE